VRLVGLTGGIASGKSTVAARFVERGMVLIDADAVARQVVEPGTPALAEIAERFGAGVLRPDGALDRPALGAVVFADAEALAALNAITHPRIGEEIARRLAEHADGDRVVVLDVALLVESAQPRDYDAVVVVTAPEEVRVSRLVRDRGMVEADARARIAAQTTDEQRLARATHVIVNDGSIERLRSRADAVADELLTEG